MALTKVSYSMITGEVINVLDYGAVADGVTNAATAIQNALNDAATLKKSVYIPAGVYAIGSTITAPSYFSLFGDPHNYTSGDNDPAGERYGSVFLFTGSINTPVIYADMQSVDAFALRNLSIRVATTFNNAGVHLLGSGYATQGGTYDCEIDNVAVIREGTIGPQVTNAVGIYFDATQAASAEGRAFFTSKVNNYYAFNLNTGLKLTVANNTAGTENFINSNIFSNIKMYQTYVGIELTGGTGGNALFRNTFSSIFIQGGLGTSGNFANSQVAASGVVTDNVFINTIVWDSPNDVFLSATHWKQNTNVQSFGYFSLDVIAQGAAVFGGGDKITGGANTQAKGVGAYNASTGQLAVYDVNDDRRRVNFGYDPTIEAGYIQAAKSGVANQPLLLNPNGGPVNIFPVNSSTPLLQNAMIFDYVSNTRIDLKFKGSDNVVRSIAFTLA
jgi:hypothetical protein